MISNWLKMYWSKKRKSKVNKFLYLWMILYFHETNNQFNILLLNTALLDGMTYIFKVNSEFNNINLLNKNIVGYEDN